MGGIKMRNRTLELCMRDGIYTISTFANLIGESNNNALLILQERYFICRKLLKRLCDIFNVSEDFLLRLD